MSAFITINVHASLRDGTALYYQTGTGSTKAYDLAERYRSRKEAERAWAHAPWVQIVEEASLTAAPFRANVPDHIPAHTYRSRQNARSTTYWGPGGRIIPLYDKYCPHARRSVHGPYRLLPSAWAIVFDRNTNTNN